MANELPALMDPQTMGILAAAFKGLSASGPSRMPTTFGQIAGEAGQAGLQQYNVAAESQRRDAQTRALIELENQRAAMTALQARQAMRNQEMQENILRGAGLIAPAAGAPTGPVAAAGVPAVSAPGAQPGGIPPQQGFPFSLGQLAAMKFAGMPDLLPHFKESQPNVSVQNGLLIDPRVGVVGSVPQTNQQGFSTMTVPDGKGGYRVAVTPGAAEAYAQQQDIAEGSKARREIVKVPPTAPNQPPREVTREQRVGELTAPRFDLVVDAPNGPKINVKGATAQDLLKAAQDDPSLAPYLAQAKPAGGGGAAAGMSPQVEADQAAQAAQGKLVSENYGKIYNDLQNASMQNPARIAKLNHVTNLLQGFEGGKLSKGGFEIARAGNSLGLKIDQRLSNKEAAEALSSEIALELRSPASGAGMPGAMSDADRDYLKGMTPNMAQSDAGRKEIVSAKVKVMERESRIADMARAYRQKHGKIDEDFFTQLQAWSNRNPIFGKK